MLIWSFREGFGFEVCVSCGVEVRVRNSPLVSIWSYI